ncbi:MAG: hypothetical protein MJ213_00620 [Bacilli bacterium]|nr:hypothetical protein [Bacilli bacterium]
MKSLINYIKRDKINSLLLLVSLIWFIVVMAIVGADFFSRFSVELEEGVREDGSLYYMVGKGIVNGYTPYVDFFETKGPFLFYICALGYLISGPNSYYAVNVFSFICILGMALLPLIFIVIRFIKKKQKNYLRFAATILAVFPLSFLLASSAQYFAGRIHAEIFCSFFVLIAFLLLYLVDGKKLKFYSPTIFITGLLFFFAALSKETFAFIAVIGVLFICRSKRDLIYKFLLPFSYGVIFALIFLAATQTLIPYFTIYIKSMIEIWLPSPDKGYTNVPFIIKMLDFPNVIRFLWGFSPILTISIIIGFLLTYFFIVKDIALAHNHSTVINVLISIWYCFSLTFITTFVLALGDPTFLHQQASGIPIYYLILLFLIDNVAFRYQLSFKAKKRSQRINLVTPVVSFISCLSIFLLPSFDYRQIAGPYTLQASKECAVYVDQVLDALNEERYQFVGNFFRAIYPYTKHLPYGPCFFQTDAMLSTNDNYLALNLKSQIQKANVVIVTNMNCGVLNTWILSYLNGYFTTDAPEIVKEIPSPVSFSFAKIFYRIV